jgi:hypothetical protein
MSKKLKSPLLTLAAFALAGQIVFWPFSGSYSNPRYESEMFATTGAWFNTSDLHALNDAAHYFGQTMIGWTRFPSFSPDLIAFASLPADTAINLHMQERQNIILTLTTKEPIDQKQMVQAKDFLQSRIDEYNKNTNTKFILTNVDYELSQVQRTKLGGATYALILSLVLGAAYLFLKKEFFPPRLKL